MAITKIKDGILEVKVDLKDIDWNNLKPSKSGKTYLLPFHRLEISMGEFDIRGNLMTYIDKDQYENYLDIKQADAERKAIEGIQKKPIADSKLGIKSDARMDELGFKLDKLLAALES